MMAGRNEWTVPDVGDSCIADAYLDERRVAAAMAPVRSEGDVVSCPKNFFTSMRMG